ncbi:MAG: ABC transporter ATP-binding protein [Thermodesulfobacteriota bacterium]
MLEIKAIDASYGNIRALHGVTLSVEEGSMVTLVGANGAGKTSTLRTVSGLLPVTAGEILFQGKPIHTLAPSRIVALGISQVPEGRRIFPGLTVAENLDMGAFLRRDRAGVRQDLDYVFSLFPVLSERRHQAGGTLSGGEQQMLAISRALMARPRLLLLDEPSLGLAPLVVKLIFSILTRINSEHGTTIFLVEQNAHLALKVCQRAYVMENGRVVLSGTSADLLKDPKVQAAYLGIA